MDIRGLRYFATVAELGSFTKAAARLNVAQPAVSRQVKQLEESIGLELLSRQGRRIRLTEAGEVLVRHARTIQRDFERLIEDMQARKETPTGRVTFGVPPSLADIVVPPVVRRLADEYPAITIQVAEGISPVLAQWLQDNQIDLAVLGLVADPEAAKARGLQEEVLTSEEMVVVERTNRTSPPHVYSRAMLEAKPLVVSQLFEAVVRGALHVPDLSLKISLAVDSMLALKAMVLAGQAATILPVSMLRQQLREGRVTASTITENGVRRQVTLAWPNFRQSTQATEAVANVIRVEIERLRHLGTFSWNPPNPGARVRFSRPAKRASLSRELA
jgi:LysR family nitrogen assimilation transcriptional regulator